jgi:hypothetical protein
MSLFENLKVALRRSLDKKKEQREFMEKLQREADMQRQQIFADQYRKNALEVAKAKAMKDAAKLSGLQKLRAENRLRNLQNQGEYSGTFFDKLRDYTQKNIARREENLKRTEMLRAKAKQMREERLKKQQSLRYVG